MKKLNLLFIGILSMSTLYAQDITDAVRYSQDEIQGSARFRALSGAFGALGGDMSAVSLNPAGSAIFSRSHASFTLSNSEVSNKTHYFGGLKNSGQSNFDLSQGGGAFVFANNDPSSPWRKFTLGIAYDKTNNFDDNWAAVGTNTNSIDSYFFQHGQGLRLDEISAQSGESTADAYSDIGNVYGFSHQQAFLGYEAFILEPNADTDDNTEYTSNLANGTFNQNYAYTGVGYNSKISFNIAAQYDDNLYLGLNLNSHTIDYQRTTLLFENNSNSGSVVNSIEFENNLNTHGSGFSFQLGGILKLSNEFRVGATYNSPTWYTIEEETTQYLATVRDDSGTNETAVVNPQIINIYPKYKLQTPSKLTGSLAYVFSKQGLISFDYSRKNYGSAKFNPETDASFANENSRISNDLKDASTYRVGGEYKHKQFSFRGGYRFEESPYLNASTIGNLTGYSFGIGYNFGNTKFDVTYDQSKRTSNTQLYNIGLVDGATIDRENSSLTLSLRFNI